MKTRSRARNCSSFFTATGVVLIHLCGIAGAATDHVWNIDGTGGSGNWSTGPGDKNWNTAVGGISPNHTWPDAGDNIANFRDGIGGTVTIFGTVVAAGVVLDGAPYTLEGGTLVLAQDGSGNIPFIDVRGDLLAIGAELAGTDGWIKSGAGNLVLSGFNTYSGPVEVAGGTLTLGASGVLAGTGTLTLANGTTLALESQNENIGNMVSNGGTISGTGKLTGSSYTLNDASFVAANLGAGILTTNGAVFITGTSAASAVNVTGGTLTLSGNNLADTAALALGSGSTLMMGGSDTVESFISNGSIVAGPGTLSAASYQLNNGSSVGGNLGNGNITTAGMVSISGSTGTGSLGISSGALNFTGTSAATIVAIDEGATLLHGGAFSGIPDISNAGNVVMNVSGTASAYTSNGGSLTGPGTLTAATYALNANSSVHGTLGGGTLTSNGPVTLTGISSADFIHMESGILFNSGILGNAGSRMHIAAGATLGAGGTQNFTLLTTSEGGTGTWRGNLTNTTTVAPGGVGTVGALHIDGNFTNTVGSTLPFDVGATSRDFLSVAGLATFGGTLEINRLGPGEIPANIPLQIVDATAHAGNFQMISENLTGEVFFNPSSGEITRLSFTGPSSLLAGATRNETAVFVSLYDDVIDPGVTNVSALPGTTSFQFTGGIADTSNPDLLAALGASITAGGLDRALLNRLSPEVYSGFTDYSMQATRSRQRAALGAPPLTATAPPAISPGAKGGKHADVAPSHISRSWEVFASVDYFNAATSASRDSADYDISGTALVGGARTSFGDRYRATAYLSVEEGDVRGRLISADAEGWSVGLLGEMLLDPAGASRLLGSLAYGSFSFDGRRGSASGTAGGWAPGSADFRDVDGSAFDAFIGIDAMLYQTDRFRLLPGIGVRYSRGSTDPFVERMGAAPGQPIALAVDRVKHESVIAEFSLTAEADLTDRLTLRGGIGFHAGFKDDSTEVSARFATGSRPMTVEAHSLSEDLLFINLGTAWRASDSISVGIGYRAEIRSGAEALNQFTLGTSFQF